MSEEETPKRPKLIVPGAEAGGGPGRLVVPEDPPSQPAIPAEQEQAAEPASVPVPEELVQPVTEESGEPVRIAEMAPPPVEEESAESMEEAAQQQAQMAAQQQAQMAAQQYEAQVAQQQAQMVAQQQAYTQQPGMQQPGMQQPGMQQPGAPMVGQPKGIPGWAIFLIGFLAATLISIVIFKFTPVGEGLIGEDLKAKGWEKRNKPAAEE
jgi:hypothetical protein